MIPDEQEQEQLRAIVTIAIHATRLALSFAAALVTVVGLVATGVAAIAGWPVAPFAYGLVTAAALFGCSLALRLHGDVLACVIVREVSR